ncbi:unnamed protein product [Allacma fusca]|uniref:Translin n=1 Tax=Allacma fusca TaxID=39272 RepID=A0A8J2JP52_9HEXA|nr:unnamed protein product [Allacma fusca]
MASNNLVDIFRVISQELDARNDKTERIVKLSRDITIESKRTISLLQRSQLQSTAERLATFQKAEYNLARVRKNNFYKLARELENESPFYFNRSYTFGLQEYIEAISFLYYLQKGTLIAHKEVQRSLVFQDVGNPGEKRPNEISSDGKGNTPENNNSVVKDISEKKRISVHVSQHDYILGLMDLTGELMRATINANPVESIQFVQDTNNFLQLVYQGSLALYGYRTKELSRKMSTLLSSVLKIESYVYSLKIRELDTFGGALTTKPIFVDAFGDQQNRHYNDDYDSGTD